MKRFKKLTAMLAALAVAAAFAGCGGITDEDAGSGAGGSAAESAAEQVADEDEVQEDNGGQAQETESEDDTDTEEAPEDTAPDDEEDGEESDQPQSDGSYDPYYNAEFGFSLPLPAGTAFAESDSSELMASADGETMFRDLMQTDMTVEGSANAEMEFSAAVYYFEADKSLDEFHEMYKNLIIGSFPIEDVPTDEAVEIGGKSAKIYGASWSADDGSKFYYLDGFIELDTGKFIVVSFQCLSSDTYEILEDCIISASFG